MIARKSLLLSLMLVGTSASCTVLEDMNGYTDGEPDAATADDASVRPDTAVASDSSAPVDTAAVDSGATPPDTTATDTATGADTSVADTAVADTGADTFAADSSVADTATGADTFVADTFVADTFVADTFVADTAPVDAGDCTGFPGAFGLSEFMVRAVSGTYFSTDRREWLEVTNYGASSLDISGVVVKVFGGTLERAAFTFPAGTSVAAGEALVIAIDKPTFMTDVSATYGTIRVFDFGKTGGDVLSNSSALDVKLYARAACTTPYEAITIPAKSWNAGVAWGYPIPSMTCTVAGRISATGGMSTTWKEVPKLAASPSYGSVALPDAGVQTMFGTPGKANTGVACP